MRFGRWTSERRARSDLASDCEAFVRGEVAGRLDAAGRPVPVWAWLNLLAHATPERLSELAAGDTGSWRGRRARRRASALSDLAARILEHAGGDPARLAELQREVLVPFEVGLAGGPRQAPVRTGYATWKRIGPVPVATPPTGGSRPPVEPAPAIGRNIGSGRLNRMAFAVLGPASVGSSPGPTPAPRRG